jgi:integrase/recombinase XerC
MSNLSKAIVRFLDAKTSVRSEKTVIHYSQTLIPFSEFAAKEWPIQPETINAYLAAAKRRGCQANTIFGYYSALRSFFNWLQQHGQIETNPIPLVEKPQKARLIPRAAKEDALTKLFNRLYLLAANGQGHYQDVRDLAIFSLAFDTGLRVGEIVVLRPEDIDLEQRTAFIQGQKTYTNRVVVFHELTGYTLANWLQVRAEIPLSPNITALFVSQYRNVEWMGLTDWGVRQALKRRCEEVGIFTFGPHTLRHSYAVFALRNGANLLDVQRQLGHTSISTTARYTLVDDEDRVNRHAEHSPYSGLRRMLPGRGEL